jgi:translocation and assembly module TamB
VNAQASQAPPAPPPRARGRWIVRLLAILLVLVLAVVLGIAWLLKTEQGARFALEQAVRLGGDGIRYEGVEGALGGTIRIKVIEVERADLYARVEDLVLETSPLAPLRGRVDVRRLGARSVELRTVDTGAAAKVPASFAPPYAVRLDDGRIGKLRVGDLTREAAAEKDPARKRALMLASREGDLVLRDLFVKGEGDQREWRIGEARVESAYGKAALSGRLESAAPFAVDLKAALAGVAAERPYQADVVARGTLRAIEANVEGEVSGQHAVGRVLVEPFAPFPLRRLELRAQEVDLSKHAEAPRTRLAVEVDLAGEDKSFSGPVRIENAEPGPWERRQLPFTSAAARIVATAERVDLVDLQVALLGGGSARGRASLQKSGVEAALQVADVDLAALHGELQKTRVTGRVTVAGDRAAQRFALALKDPRFEVEGRGALARQRLEVETVRIATGGGAVVAKGAMGLAGAKDFRFEGRAEHFDPSAFVKTTKGDLNFTFVASGALEPRPSGELRAEIAPSTYAGLPASGRIHLAGDRSRIANADVNVLFGQARLRAQGRFGGPGDALDVSVRAPDLAALARPFGVALAGSLEGEGRLTGTFASPAGRVSLAGANLTLPSNVYVREARLRAEAGVEPASPIDASLQAKGVALGEQRPPTPFAETLAATLKGTRAAHRLEADAVMTREATLRVALQGGLDPRAREPAWNGRVESLSLTGRGAFALTAPTALHASAGRIEVGDALLRGEWGEAHMQVTRWTPRTLELRGSSPGIQIQNLARSLRLGPVPRSNLVMAADWDIRSAETFDGTLDLRRVSGDLRIGEPSLPLGLQTLELKARAVRGRAQASLDISGERVGRIQGEGSGLLARGKTGWELAPGAPMRARLVAEHTNLEALAPWLGAEAKLGGRLNADVSVSGTGADPRVAGEARVVDLVLREPQSGFEMEQGQLLARMAGKSLTIERFTAVTPWRPAASARKRFAALNVPAAGTVSAEGAIDLGARTGALRIKAERAVLTQSPSRFLAVSGDARLQSEGQGMLATGAFKADAGWIGALEAAPPSVSEDVVVVRASQPAPEPKRGEGLRIEARFSLGEHLYFEGRGLDTRLAGEVQVSGTPTALRAVGTIRTVGGTYNGYGQKLAIERGVLRFAGPVDNPQLSVLAVRKGLPVEPGVEVLGTVMRPRVRLVSTPDVPEPEKLSWLVLGRGPSDLAPGDASVLLAAATAMLGRNNPGSDLGQRFGLDEVRIGRADTGSMLGVLPQSTVAGKTGSASAAEVVSVGKKLTRDLNLSYEQGLADAEGALKITWQITQQFQVLVRAGFLPGLDAVYKWTFK